MNVNTLLELGEFSAAGLYEEPERSLFYRKALGLRRYYETCALPSYTGLPLYPSGSLETPRYLDGLAVDLEHLQEEHPEIAAQIREEFCQGYASVPYEHGVAGIMYTHAMPHYERILKEGLGSYAQRIAAIQDTDMREGLQHLLQGITCYVQRCVEYLESVGAETRLIEALKKVPLSPADTLYEALVCWNMVLYLDQCDDLGCLVSGLSPYFKGENVIPILENLFDNLNANNGYTMVMGTAYAPLMLQCLEASKGRRRPMIELFVDENTPDEVWQKAFEVIRTSNGQPAFYNPRVLLGGLQQRFPAISDKDILQFCGGGCTETMIAGLSNVGSLDAGINLLLILENCIHTQLVAAPDFETFYEGFIREVKEVVETVTTEISRSQQRRALCNPLPMRTLLVDDCIDRGLDYNNGGARYQWSLINFAGMINVIDGLLVIRDMVFVDKTYTAEELIDRLKNNDEKFLSAAKTHKISFGNDNADANAFSHKISTEIYAMLDHKKPFFGDGFLPASIQFRSQVEAGKAIGATPDGRSAGAPLCDSLGAIFGKDTQGPTALLNSVTSLDLARALGVPVLNFNIAPDFKDETLKALIMSYMQMGGIQMQITCISRSVLEDAYEHPELYRNLVVRVGGYSEYFSHLSDELKRMVINRTIQK